MSAARSFSYLRLLKAFIALWLIVLAASCTIVKKYQPNKPFVYKTNINLIGNFTNEEKEGLVSGLKGQLDDSLRVRTLNIDILFLSILKNPPVYDSTNADKSIMFMRALLVSLGYFSDSIHYHHIIKKEKKDQLRTTITFDVKPGRQWLLDSVVYNIKKAELQKLADSTKKEAIIKKGDPFAKVPISAELDRLTELFRNNGYLKFTRDELIGLWDTLDVALLQPTLDPFEQLQLLQQLRERRLKPTANLEFRLRNIDSAKLTKYYNGNITVYPDFNTDTLGLQRSEVTVKGIKVVQYRNKFKPKIFPSNIYLPRDSVYRQRRYIRTLNRLYSLGTWKLVTIDTMPRKNQDTVDFAIKMTPAQKYLFTTNLEGSVNQTAISGNLFGIGVNVGVQNRNQGRAANLASTNVRYGVELGANQGNQFIQSQQVSLGYSLYFPRAVLIDGLINDKRKDNWRTVLSTNASFTKRRLLYDLTNLNAAGGYEYQRGKLLLTGKLNIEYSLLDKKDSLKRLIDSVPSLRNIFTDGLVFSTIFNLTYNWGNNKILNVVRANFEGSPLLLGLFHNPFLDTQVYRFIKIDAEFAKLFRFRKTSFALRFFGGLGIADPFHTTVNPLKRNTLPFFKQYFSGGPNSMRAWALRRLGPGSTVKNFAGSDGTPDRYGDVQLEANAEFRFPIAKPLGIKVDGALFTDIGNIWLLKKAAGPPEEVFDFSSLGKDIAVGLGVGLRVDFSLFVIRFDYSYKVKDPSPSIGSASVQNKWFGYKFFNGTQFQLGIGLPFIF